MKIEGERNGNVLVYSMEGRLDAQTYQEAEKRMRAWLDQGEVLLVGDLTGLDYISSAGLRVLLMITKELGKKGGRMGLCGLKDPVREVFDMAGISDIIPISLSREEALSALNG